jgi:hypothetical protein
LLAKCLAINAVSITQQIPRCGFERESFQNLSRGPFRRWMRRNVEVHQTSTIVPYHNKDEQNLEEGSRYGEEVDRNQLSRVIV